MRVLLVTNDFPPVLGGIQSYVRDYVDELVRREGPESVIVFAATPPHMSASAWDRQQSYTVVRWPHRLLLPTPSAANAMAELIRVHKIDTVWFGAAAPLAVLGQAARRAGAQRVVATTHGHEVGWSMLPGTRQMLQRIGQSADVVSYISRFTLARLRPVFGSHPDYVALPSGVDTDFFHPVDESTRKRVRDQLGVADAPLIVCASRLVPRKGQDQLIRALPEIRRRIPGARLVLVGSGHYGKKLRRLARGVEGVSFTGAVDRDTLRDIMATADVFAMPARTRGRGLDLEGLGIVYLEAQACAVPVVAGDSGGAPETVTDKTGVVIDGRDLSALIGAVSTLLEDAALRHSMGQAGREHVSANYSWEILGDRFRDVLQTQNPAV